MGCVVSATHRTIVFRCSTAQLTLLVCVFGGKSLQQGSHDVPWDLLVFVYQRLDCLLHLHSKKMELAATIQFSSAIYCRILIRYIVYSPPEFEILVVSGGNPFETKKQ